MNSQSCRFLVALVSIASWLSESVALAVSCGGSATPRKVVISGAGPCGLYLAALLMEQDNDHEHGYEIHVLEKHSKDGKPGNAFGLGLSPRLHHSLDALEGLKDTVMQVGSRVEALSQTYSERLNEDFDFRMASRQDICQQMRLYLEDRYQSQLRSGQLKLCYNEACQSADYENKIVTTSKGRQLPYDLLVGADGVHSPVRESLPLAQQVEHYVTDIGWKALEIPPQPGIPQSAFLPLKHPSCFGQLLPRYPEGHFLLLFFHPTDTGNPPGIDTVSEFKQAVTQMLQAIGNPDLPPLLHPQSLENFVSSRPGRSHVMKIPRYHDADASVVLIGDAAHGMYNLLGQGCACGLQNTRVLRDCLRQEPDLTSALELYSQLAVPEGHAITDLNLIGHLPGKNPLSIRHKIQLALAMAWQKIRGTDLRGRVGRADVSYTQMLRENKAIVDVARVQWEKERLPVPEEWKKQLVVVVSADKS